MSDANKDIQLASEEVNRRNVRAAVDYSNETRRMLRQMEAQVEEFKKLCIQQKNELTQLKNQVTLLLVEKYSKKPTK